RVETFAEPIIDRSKKIAGLIPPALIAPQPRHAYRSAQFPGLRLLRPRNRERALEILFSFRHIRLRQQQRDFPGNAIGLSLEPPFLGCFHSSDCFTDAAHSVIELS